MFREWYDRLNFSVPATCSNREDPELLVHVPFDGTVKLKAICVIGTSHSCPLLRDGRRPFST